MPLSFSFRTLNLLSVILFATGLCDKAQAILPDTAYIRYPEKLGLIYRDLSVITQDGYRIATWFFPAQDTLPLQEVIALQKSENPAKRPYTVLDNQKRPTIIICNGDAANMSYFQLHLAMAWTFMGFNVVTFDWRGFGASSPFPMDPDYLCYTEMLEDYRAVIDATAQQPETDPNAIVIMGWSTGAYLSMITAYRNDKVAAFIGRSLCTTFKDFIPLVMQVRNKTNDQLVVPQDFPVQEMPVEIAAHFHKPVFLINGDRDLRTPLWMSKKILDLLPEDCPMELMVVPGAAHGGKEDPIMLAFEEFTARVATFLNKVLKVPSTSSF